MMLTGFNAFIFSTIQQAQQYCQQARPNVCARIWQRWLLPAVIPGCGSQRWFPFVAHACGASGSSLILVALMDDMAEELLRPYNPVRCRVLFDILDDSQRMGRTADSFGLQQLVRRQLPEEFRREVPD